MEMLNKVLDFLMGSGGAMLAGFIEMVLRIIPSEKPLSLILVVSKFLVKVSEYINVGAKLIDALAQFLAKFGQNIKPVEPPK
jgi:hypothetical protein